MLDLSVQSLGRVRFVLEGTEVRLRTRKHRALALYLISAPTREHPRRALAELFWDPRGGRELASLSQGLHEIRDVLGLNIDGWANPVRLSARNVRFDARLFTDAAARGEHRRALRLYRGDFAPALARCGSPDFELWCERERMRYQSQVAISLSVLCRRYEEENASELLLALTQEWARRFPADDVMQQRFGEALLFLGHRHEANAILRRLDSG